tara:strand:+ start:20 stop:1231 length:1212 start_codon:yes stop_codon:yes gene_type:complete
MKITKEELDSLIKEAAKDYVWGMKNISRLGNKYKLTTIKRIIREELEAVLDEKKKKKKKKKAKKRDACYHKVRSRYDVWPSAYASGALVQCRKVGAKNWGKSTTKEELELYEGKESLEAKIRNILIEEGGAAGMKAFVEGTEASEKEIKDAIEGMKDVAEHEHGDYYLVEDEVVDENLNKWFKEKWVQAVSGKPCARQPGQKTTPKCVKSSKRASMSKKERESTQRRKRAADPNQPKKTGAAKPTYVSTDKPKKKKKAKKEGMTMDMERLKEIIMQEMKDVLDTYDSEVTDRNKKSREEGSKALGLTEAENAYYEMLSEGEVIEEAEYQGRKVKLNKPMRGDVKKSKVYVKNAKGNVVKVNFGDKNMKIKKNIPARRKSFRARHKCKTPGPKWKARYWSCKAW